MCVCVSVFVRAVECVTRGRIWSSVLASAGAGHASLRRPAPIHSMRPIICAPIDNSVGFYRVFFYRVSNSTQFSIRVSTASRVAVLRSLSEETRFQFEMVWNESRRTYWVLLGLNGFEWVLLGFTGCYLVLLGFTGLYLVLLGYT